MRMALWTGLLAVLLAGALPARAEEEPLTGEAARLAIEEAELRERMITALAIGESVRLRGRTILVAILEIQRVARSVAKLSPGSESRRDYEQRLAALRERLRALDAEVDREWLSYLEIVSELAGDLWPRLERVGTEVAAGLAERRLSRLADLYPVVAGHIEEFHRAETVTQGMTTRWRAEIDDSYYLRLEKREGLAPPEPSVSDEGKTEEDI